MTFFLLLSVYPFFAVKSRPAKTLVPRQNVNSLHFSCSFPERPVCGAALPSPGAALRAESKRKRKRTAAPALFPARPPGAPHFRRPQPLSGGAFRPVVAPDNSPFGHDPPLYFSAKGCYHLIVHTAQPNAFPASPPRPPLSEGLHKRPGARYLPHGGKI